MMLSSSDLEFDVKCAEKLMAAINHGTDYVSRGPATFFGFRVNFLRSSKRHVWFKRGDKEYKVPRHWLIGSCKQGDSYVV